MFRSSQVGPALGFEQASETLPAGRGRCQGDQRSPGKTNHLQQLSTLPSGRPLACFDYPKPGHRFASSRLQKHCLSAAGVTKGISVAPKYQSSTTAQRLRQLSISSLLRISPRRSIARWRRPRRMGCQNPNVSGVAEDDAASCEGCGHGGGSLIRAQFTFFDLLSSSLTILVSSSLDNLVSPSLAILFHHSNRLSSSHSTQLQRTIL